MRIITPQNNFLITAAMLPLALAACAAQPNSDDSAREQVPVKVYSKTTAVTAPATSYYDPSDNSTVYISPTKTTTEAVGPADVTYEDDEGFWHTTYDTGDTGE